MRIAQVIDTLGWGGAQKMTVSLSSSLRDRNLDVTVISLGAEDAPFAVQLRQLGVPFICLPSRHIFDPFRFGRLVGVLRQGDFDLIQTYLTYANILGGMAGTLAGVPVVASLRNEYSDRRHYNPLRFRIETWVLRHLVRRVVTNAYAIADAHRVRVGRTLIDVIPNTVPLPGLLSDAERTSVRAELTNGCTGPIVISVGRMAAAKGYPDLLSAFAAIAPRFSDASLVIVGGGKLMPQLREQVHKLGMDDRIFLLGARDDIPRLLMASDVYVSASHWEGMSVALLEAMAAGLPVVATTVGDAQRMVIDGTGLLVKPHQPGELANALAELLANPRRCKLLGAAGRAHVAARYDRDAWVQAFIDLYKEVASLS